MPFLDELWQQSFSLSHRSRLLFQSSPFNFSCNLILTSPSTPMDTNMVTTKTGLQNGRRLNTAPSQYHNHVTRNLQRERQIVSYKARMVSVVLETARLSHKSNVLKHSRHRQLWTSLNPRYQHLPKLGDDS